ncbi:MAG: helix-turn-helix transcriptional regulator [Candidatus Gastranaerophilales bacterium]|nr:helix-turn-helix transcriptional regulator [Candidatus Gastranaerophilales bacterium]
MCKDTKKINELYYKLGQNIKQYRKEKNISQEKLAFSINTARNYIGCIERGEKRPSLATIYKITLVLKISLTELFKDIG